MKAIRKAERKKAATIGDYAMIAQLGHSSSAVKHADRRSALVDDLEMLFLASRPRVMYTHNPFDKHASHVEVFLAVV